MNDSLFYKKEEESNNINDTIRDDSNEDKSKGKIKRTVYCENAPYDNVTAWTVGWFFWPIAWAILSYILKMFCFLSENKYNTLVK